MRPVEYSDIRKLVDEDALNAFRRRSMNPEAPTLRGLIDNPEHYFQMLEAGNPIIDKVRLCFVRRILFRANIGQSRYCSQWNITSRRFTI